MRVNGAPSNDGRRDIALMDADIQFPILLTLEEALQGTTREFYFARVDTMCRECNGTGKVAAFHLGPGVRRPCQNCLGQGMRWTPCKVTCDVPPGVAEQVRLRVPGQGRLLGEEGGWGDLYLVCYLRPHRLFRKVGFDLELLVDETIPCDHGSTLESPRGLITIPSEGLDSGAIQRIAGGGFPRYIGGDDCGDIVIKRTPERIHWNDEELQIRKERARTQIGQQQWREAIAELRTGVSDRLLDAESFHILAVCYDQVQEPAQARSCFLRAIELEPGNPTCYANFGVFLLHRSQPLGALCAFEASLRRHDTPETRRALTSAAGLLARQIADLLRGHVDASVIERIETGITHRHYPSIRRHIQRSSAGASPEVTLAASCLALVTCHMGYEEFISEVISSIARCRKQLHRLPLLDDAIAATEAYADCICGLPGALKLAEYCIEKNSIITAIPYLRTAARRARTHNKVLRRFRLQHDPVEMYEEDQTRASLARLEDSIHAASDDGAVRSQCAGLFNLTRAHFTIRDTLQVEAGWSYAVGAVEHLEASACESPDDQRVHEHLFQALDLMEGIAKATMADCDPHLLDFTRNSCDAATVNLLSLSPLNVLARPGEPTDELEAICSRAYSLMFDRSRGPMPGEFLVDFREGHYMLTNYRVLLLGDSMPRLIPLSGVKHYSVRTAGVSLATVVVQKTDGTETVLNDRAKGSVPGEALLNHLLAARMWDGLTGVQLDILAAGKTPKPPNVTEQKRLAAGPAAPTALPQQPVSPALTTGALGATCQACGTAARQGDVFCRRCGARLVSGQEAGPPALE